MLSARREGPPLLSFFEDVRHVSENPFGLTTNPRFLIGATGSIAVSELPGHLNALRATFGGTYTVVMTHTAEKFVPPQTLQLVAERVVAGEDPADWPTDRPSRLAGDHDLVVVLPATTNVLAAAASGAAPNRLLTVILSSARPSIFVPHMGAAMWQKPAVRRNVAQLRADGHHVVEPEWHDSRDVITGELVRHPAIPSPERVVALLRDLCDPPDGKVPAVRDRARSHK